MAGAEGSGENGGVSAQSPTLAEVLDLALTRRLEELHTMLPGRIESFDAATQTADVQPLVHALALQEDGNRVAVPLPVLPGIPVVFPGSGGYRSTYPVAKGDSVLVLFAEACIDAWQPHGGAVEPGSRRRHHLADAVAVVGLRDNDHQWKGVATDAATWGKDGGPQVVARSGALELGSTADNRPTDALVLGTTYRQAEDAFLQAISTAAMAVATALSPAVIAGFSSSEPGAAAVAAALNALATSLQSAANTFKGGASTFLSTVVWTK